MATDTRNKSRSLNSFCRNPGAELEAKKGSRYSFSHASTENTVEPWQLPEVIAIRDTMMIRTAKHSGPSLHWLSDSISSRRVNGSEKQK